MVVCGDADAKVRRYVNVSLALLLISLPKLHVQGIKNLSAGKQWGAINTVAEQKEKRAELQAKTRAAQERNDKLTQDREKRNSSATAGSPR